MRPEDLRKIAAKLPLSQSTLRRNQIAHEINASAVGAMVKPERKPSPGAALDGQPARQPRRKGSVAVVVEIIACRRGELDSDNLIAGCKPIRDAIARSLGVDDGDERVRWCYGQCRTDGEPGTIVRITDSKPQRKEV